MSFPKVNAVILICPDCGERSKPLDPDLTFEEAKFSHESPEGFERSHEKLHFCEYVKQAGEALSHRIQMVFSVMERDRMLQIPRCSCGWEGRENNRRAAQDEAHEHHCEQVLIAARTAGVEEIVAGVAERIKAKRENS